MRSLFPPLWRGGASRSHALFFRDVRVPSSRTRSPSACYPELRTSSTTCHASSDRRRRQCVGGRADAHAATVGLRRGSRGIGRACLPGIDGFEVLRQLSRDNHSGSILILTAHDAEADRVRGLDLGADDYVAKPFSLPELEARVRALIRRSQAVKSPKLRFGRLSVATVARRASIGSDLLDITPREWAVLEYLLVRVGQVVSNEHMLQAMCSWDA